ncbi:hypothetical protein E2C01_054977 [Portunus trituberculatus]|uniref:Uncharacterized protein n=1 Tax=Portunus trituberculatus TaxID=210409 RepID=A0A5B7GUP7_PORTR|nr:hypothetical protein [Portunus trituberculatus]
MCFGIRGVSKRMGSNPVHGPSVESIRAVLLDTEGMDEDDLQQMTDRLSDVQAAAGRHINAVLYASSIAPPPVEDDIAVINHAPACARQPLVRQQPKPRKQP